MAQYLDQTLKQLARLIVEYKLSEVCRMNVLGSFWSDEIQKQKLDIRFMLNHSR
jgi:hypothetical protein